jgi:uncharacterized membrane protein (UPF0182 family)
MDDDSVFPEPKVIDVPARKRRFWLIALAVIIVAVLLFGSQFVGIYIDALWFRSLGYAGVYWYKFRLGGLLFAIFLVLTFLILRLALFLLARAFPRITERPPIKFSTIEDFREINVLPYIFRPGVWILSVGVALLYAVSMSGSWSDFALYLNSAPSGATDPIFQRDISFYLFTLPVLQDLSGWITTLTVIIFLIVSGVAGYLWYLDNLRGFRLTGVGGRAVSAISLAAACFALALAFATYLDRFGLLQQPHDLFTGIAYTDEHVQLPALTAAIVGLIIAAILLVANAIALRRIKLIGWIVAGVAAIWIVGVWIFPASVYSFSVKPNELAKEAPYIEHNIRMTRTAFGLDRFEERPFQPTPTLTLDQLNANRTTLDNVRLWDPPVLQKTLGQIQEIRQYYDFNTPDIDRYKLNGKLTEVMLAAREINVDKLSGESKNWINQHLVYTHGYGVTMNTVNEFTPEGMPHLVLKDMPVQSEVTDLKVTRPEIYFGEMTNEHVYVHTAPQGRPAPEFNYPASGNVDSYTEYEGDAGIRVGSFLQKIPLALALGDGTNLLFSDYVRSESRLLLHRNVMDRVMRIAPFLSFDSDPYIVIDGNGKLFWVIDAFTSSTSYPYSTPYPLGANPGQSVANPGAPVNYIRNSVKAVVDAYLGTVDFYVFEPDDPIVKSYQNIFPTLFHPASDMPEDLRQHVRYPNPLVDIQARAYATYHMQSPQILYSHEDLWTIPAEPPADAMPGQPNSPRQMRPYFVVMQLPGEPDKRLEYVNILPFTPAGKDRNNMIGWMAGRSDGENYGHVLVFSFPKNLTVYGPEQVRSRVNQDPTLSGQMTLWNQQGSKLRRGNLLVIPIDDSLLYVEPFFLQAENSPLPELRQVAVAAQDKLGTGKTFTEALNALFPGFGSLQPGMVAGAAPSAGHPAAVAGSQPVPAGQPSPTPGQAQTAPVQTSPANAAETARLASQARQLLSEYGKLASEGRYQEAGQKLDQLKQTLDELARKQGGG